MIAAERTTMVGSVGHDGVVCGRLVRRKKETARAAFHKRLVKRLAERLARSEASDEQGEAMSEMYT